MTAPIPRSHYRPPAPPATLVQVEREHPTITSLKVCAYICTTIASLVFVVLVVVLYIKVQQFQSAMELWSNNAGPVYDWITPPPPASERSPR